MGGVVSMDVVFAVVDGQMLHPDKREARVRGRAVGGGVGVGVVVVNEDGCLGWADERERKVSTSPCVRSTGRTHLLDDGYDEPLDSLSPFPTSLGSLPELSFPHAPVISTSSKPRRPIRR